MGRRKSYKFIELLELDDRYARYSHGHSFLDD